ncbi:MAG TPA: DNA internalization-related competence protein ComEC/Rec2, partial [Bacillota bacterium]|nr:DNA internalization-related competence protein ComEC/Rec2 [Bacillota bacterium]
DIEQEQEMALLHRYPNLNVDVLKVAHHGSATSTAETFLQQINPEIALISVGENNPFHHPSPDVIARLQNKEIEILRTDEHGAVQFIFGERSGTFFTYLP